MKHSIVFKLNQQTPITKTSNKALLAVFSVDQTRGGAHYTGIQKWVPRSVCQVNGSLIYVKTWFATKNLRGMTLKNGKTYVP